MFIICHSRHGTWRLGKPHYDTWHTVGSMASIASESAWKKAIGGRGQVGEMLVVFKTCEDLALVM